MTTAVETILAYRVELHEKNIFLSNYLMIIRIGLLFLGLRGILTIDFSDTFKGIPDPCTTALIYPMEVDAAEWVKQSGL